MNPESPLAIRTGLAPCEPNLCWLFEGQNVRYAPRADAEHGRRDRVREAAENVAAYYIDAMITTVEGLSGLGRLATPILLPQTCATCQNRFSVSDPKRMSLLSAQSREHLCNLLGYADEVLRSSEKVVSDLAKIWSLRFSSMTSVISTV